MKSPLGSHRNLEAETLDEGLVAFRCPETGGLYIKLEDYWRWNKGCDGQHRSEHCGARDIPVSEFDETAKICPESGTLMTRYSVGHGLPFRVDRSVTGGVWLDAGEWEALRSGEVHHSLHLVFTAPWQKAIREENHAAQEDKRLREHLGEEFHARLRALRDEIWAHRSRAEALAFIQSAPESSGQ